MTVLSLYGGIAMPQGVVYQREGINGDYDAFEDVEELIVFIKTGRKV